MLDRVYQIGYYISIILPLLLSLLGPLSLLPSGEGRPPRRLGEGAARQGAWGGDARRGATAEGGGGAGGAAPLPQKVILDK